MFGERVVRIRKQPLTSEFTPVLQADFGSSPPADPPVERSFDHHGKENGKKNFKK